jgi:hypothetical protein
MVEILFGLFVGNNNGDLRRATAIPSSPQNSKIAAILIVPEQQICVWIHNCYSYSKNNNYSVIPDPSKHTLSASDCSIPELHPLWFPSIKSCIREGKFGYFFTKTRYLACISFRMKYIKALSTLSTCNFCKTVLNPREANVSGSELVFYEFSRAPPK